MSEWHFMQYSSIIKALAGMKLPSTVRDLAGSKYFSPSGEPFACHRRGSWECMSNMTTVKPATVTPQPMPQRQRMAGPARRCST